MTKRKASRSEHELPSLHAKSRHRNAVNLDSYCPLETMILPNKAAAPIDSVAINHSRIEIAYLAGSTDTSSPRGVVAMRVGTNWTPP